jgi:hypothetical protein
VVLEDQQGTHVALPKLYGQPSYSRRGVIADRPRPIDPDDLPIAAFQTDDERDLAETLEGRRSLPYVTVPVEPASEHARAAVGTESPAGIPAPFAPRALEATADAPRRRGLGRLLGG